MDGWMEGGRETRADRREGRRKRRRGRKRRRWMESRRGRKAHSREHIPHTYISVGTSNYTELERPKECSRD
jgi:hypothetical protein